MSDVPKEKKSSAPIDPKTQTASCQACSLILVVMGVIFYTVLHATNPTGTTPEPFPSSATAPTPSPPSQPSAVQKDLEVLDTDWKQENSIVYVVGTVANHTQRTYSYVQVEINIYDTEGNQIESTFANVNNLEPGKKWKFKALLSEHKNGMTFKIKGVTGY